ncbi:hypothetical protein BDW69DRAFT_177557 [Aspergillus filifer]
MEYLPSDIIPSGGEIKVGKDWYCCMKKCQSYNKANAKECSQCQHERCADCQGPMHSLTQLPLMWICCACGDGPKTIWNEPYCNLCCHAMCSCCTMVK